MKVIKDANTSDSFYGMYIYFSPAFDSRLYQEDLDEDQYVEWLSKFLDATYSPDYLSPFSANASILKHQVIPATSTMSDRQAEFELTVFKKLKESTAYNSYSSSLKLIGPDRDTV